jgi:hypothetical protein
VNGITDASSGTRRVDIEAMRDTVGLVLQVSDAPHTQFGFDAEELQTLTERLRGHLHVLIPEVERLLRGLPKGGVERYCGLACLGDARQRLRAVPSHRYGGPPGHARRLARALHALCEHYAAIV